MGKKIFIGTLITLFLVLCGGAFIGWTWYSQQQEPVDVSDTSPIAFVVAKDETATQVLESLHAKNLIHSVNGAKLYLKLNNIDANVRPGSYNLSRSQTFQEILNTLQTEPIGQKITFPEGWRREQYALRLRETFPGFDMTSFIDQSASLEGRLFPDTYIFPRTVTPEKVISVLYANFQKKSQIIETQTYTQGLTGLEVVNLASIIEREAKKPEERPMVASILLNRMRDGEGLYVDATIQYGRDTDTCQTVSTSCKYWTPIFDTKYVSIYNTYLHQGLPPTPIANPGKASLDAVLNPAVTEYKYYLTDPQGVTHYAKSLAEHNLNVDKYLKP